MQRKAGRLVLVAVILLAATMPAVGQFQVYQSVFIAPESIPFDLSGSGPTPTGIIRLVIASNGVTEPDRRITTLDVTLNGDLIPTDLSEIYVTYEAQWDEVGNVANPDRNGTYDADATEVLLGSMSNEGGSSSFTGTGPYSLTINLADNKIYRQQQGYGYAFFFVAVDFANGVDATKAVDIRVENIDYEDYVGGANPGTLAGPFPGVAGTIQLDDYEVTVTGDASFLGTGTLAPPGSTVTALKLDFGIDDFSLAGAGHAKVNSLRFRRIGDAVDTDTATNGITVYADDDGTPGFSGGDTIFGQATMSGGVATVNLTTNDLFLSTGNLTYYVAVSVSNTAVPGHTFGLDIESPATHVVFGDGVTDIQIDSSLATYGFIDAEIQSFEYDQVGLIAPVTPSTPTTTYTFEIDEGEDVTPPTVTLTTPEDGETGVARNTIIRVVFSEEMATIEPADLTIVGSESGNIDPTTHGTFTFNTTTNQSFTFTRSTPYVYEETVTVTVSGSVTDNSANLNPMGADYVFSFTIAPETNPTVLGTVPADGSGNVALTSTVSLIFSEPMNESTVTDPANFTLVEQGATTGITGIMTYNDAANTATFTPDESFAFDTTYVATVTTGVRDAEGSALAANYSFSFTTTRQIGDFTDAIVANNRISPDSGDPMRIFVEVPAGGSATDTVTIQVFTATGRRVATLTTAGETYEEVIARQPILWDGTNGRGQPLGPGLYFVQVSSTGFRKAMRVLIVR